MTPTLRKRLLIGAAAVVVLLIVALLAAPSLIDLDARKTEIIAAVKKATGRDLVIDGPVSLRLLPIPTATVTDVKFFNVAGAKNPNMVEVKSVTVKVSLLALLTGRIDVSEVMLVEPKIVLEINAEGKPNWEFTPSVAEAKPAAPVPSTPRGRCRSAGSPSRTARCSSAIPRRVSPSWPRGQISVPRSARSTDPIHWPGLRPSTASP